MTGDVADNDPQRSGWDREQVVPVAADGATFGGDVARRELEPGASRQPAGEQAAFQQRRRRPFDGVSPRLDRRRHAFGQDREQRDVRIAERPPLKPPDVHHPEHLAAS